MLYRINDRNQYTNPMSMEAKRYIELSWCGVLTNMSLNDILLVEDEVVKVCALGDKVSAADVNELLGVKYSTNEEMKTYFTKDFTLEFIIEETNKRIECQKIYRLEFNTRPVMDEDEEQEEEDDELVSNSLSRPSPNRNTLIKESILSDISVLTDYVRDNFMDWNDTSVVLGRLDVIHEKVSNLEVK